MNRTTLMRGALAAALLGSFAFTASAADLGGSCCADLEERIAELEATAAKKGNRKVSLSISGYVTQSVMFWDDGAKKDMFIGDGGNVSSRFRFTGEAKISPTMKAGFVYEFGAKNNSLNAMNQTGAAGLGGDDLGGAIEVRKSEVWLAHDWLGKAKIGHGSTATDDLILIDLSNASVISSADAGLYNGSFFIRAKVPGSPLTGLTWNQVLNGGVSFDTVRRNHVMWESPSLAGFTVAAAVAENNFWDVALRYVGEFSGVRIAGGVGRSVDSETPGFGPFAAIGVTANKITDTKGSVSVMHTPTGLYVTAAAGLREIDWAVPVFGGAITAKDGSFWHVQAGVQRRVFELGATTVYGEYQQAKDMMGYEFRSPGATLDLSSNATVWGFGVVQQIDAAAMDLFLSYKNYTADASVSGALSGKIEAETFSAVIGGARINF